MQIKTADIQPGDNLIFKRAKGDYVGLFFSLLLKLFNPNWDMWGWHMAIIVRPDGEDWIVLEATWPCCRLNRLSNMGECRIYRWLDVEPDKNKIADFAKAYCGKRYDILLYPWTMVQYLVRHYWNRPVPRLLDDRYTCWELATEFDEAMGKPICSKYDCPILPNIQRELEK